MKTYYILLAAVITGMSAKGQITLELDFPDTGSKTYIAKNKIEFLKGYEYTRVGNDTLVAYLDPVGNCMGALPAVNFLVDTEVGVGDTVQFIQVSNPDPEDFLWNFGDGTTSSLADPVHTYLVPGSYDVSLTTAIKNCYGQITKTISVLPSQTDVTENDEDESAFFSIREASISPNPSNGRYDVHVLLSMEEEITLRFLSLSGRVFAQKKLTGIEIHEKFDFSFLPTGMYILHITAGNRSKVLRFLKR